MHKVIKELKLSLIKGEITFPQGQKCAVLKVKRLYVKPVKMGSVSILL